MSALPAPFSARPLAAVLQRRPVAHTPQPRTAHRTCKMETAVVLGGRGLFPLTAPLSARLPGLELHPVPAEPQSLTVCAEWA